MLRIALPNKGRLSEEARLLFADAGLEVRAHDDRALIGSLGGEFAALFVRAADIPEFIADGAADAGVTGYDLLCESDRRLDTIMDLEFGRCRMVVAARDECAFDAVGDVPENACVATVFPNVARRYFAEHGRSVRVVPVSGAAEIAPHLGIADVIVDLTSTGSTLKVNGLRELSTIFHSTARLVATPASAGRLDASARRALDDLGAALASVLRARGKRYLMANVPRDRLACVKEALPGLNGPTVMDVMNGGTFAAVHAVVEASSINRILSRLRELGAQGILVTRIERLIP